MEMEAPRFVVVVVIVVDAINADARSTLKNWR